MCQSRGAPARAGRTAGARPRWAPHTPPAARARPVTTFIAFTNRGLRRTPIAAISRPAPGPVAFSRTFELMAMTRPPHVIAGRDADDLRSQSKRLDGIDVVGDDRAGGSGRGRDGKGQPLGMCRPVVVPDAKSRVVEEPARIEHRALGAVDDGAGRHAQPVDHAVVSIGRAERVDGKPRPQHPGGLAARPVDLDRECLPLDQVRRDVRPGAPLARRLTQAGRLADCR